MSRLIDADELIDFIDIGHLRNPLEACFSERDVVDMLESRPTVDAVPVVRCGKCKNYDVETAWCKIHSYFVNSNGDFCHPWESNEWKMFDGAYYCAGGERMVDNGT